MSDEQPSGAKDEATDKSPRKPSIGQAVWAYNRLMEEIIPASRATLTESPEDAAAREGRIAAYGSIIERAAARAREDEQDE